MKGRIWLFAGVILGLAIAAGRLPYLAGAGRSLSDTAERLVNSAAQHLIRDAANAGASRRVVLALGAVVGAVLPGLAAFLLVLAARGSLRLRAIVAILVVALGAASYVYQPEGKATGVLILALAVAGLAVALTGPLVALPLTAAATLIGAEFLPGLLMRHRAVTQVAVNNLHFAIYNKGGTPTFLQIVVLVLAAVPFALAARLVLKS